MEPDTDLLKQAYMLLSWRVEDGSATPEEQALSVLLAPLFDSPVCAAPPRRRAEPPKRASLIVQLPAPGRRADAVMFEEYRGIALSIRGARGEWVQLVAPGEVGPSFLHNWVSKIHGSVRGFAPGEFEAAVRGGRLFARVAISD
ncbi:MAG: hypothetical protein IPK85_02950 [Gemmatimonadetes bacterium]|nr:hypothetical protein [Gemmatimonadota bacterium]